MNKLISEQDEEKLADYDRLKLEYTRLHEDYRRLQSKKDRQLALTGVVQAKPEVCEHPKPFKSTPWGYKVCCKCNDIVEKTT